MRFSSAFFSASLRALGFTPSCWAASFTIAWLSSFGDPSFVAAIAPPAPAIAEAATAPAITFRLRFRSMRAQQTTAG